MRSRPQDRIVPARPEQQGGQGEERTQRAAAQLERKLEPTRHRAELLALPPEGHWGGTQVKQQR